MLPKGIKFPQNLSVKVVPTTKPTGGNHSVVTGTARGASYQKNLVSGMPACTMHMHGPPQLLRKEKKVSKPIGTC